MHQTVQLKKMASTHAGMCRILKQKLSPVDFIRKAVQTGIYKEMHQKSPSASSSASGPSNRTKLNPSKYSYPIEYEILSLNPPIPQPPRIPLKEIRKIRASEGKVSTSNASSSNSSRLPLDKYVQAYMRRYDAQMRASRSISPQEMEEYQTRKMLGVAPNSTSRSSSSSSTAMGRKSQVLQDAYEFALKQYQILQTHNNNKRVQSNSSNDTDDLTEEESIQMVQELLQQEERNERLESRRITRSIVQDKARLSSSSTSSLEDDDEEEQENHHADISSTNTTTPRSSSSASTNTNLLHDTIPSILYSKPKTIQALHIWGSRLRSVPYAQWTLGASTALDHWIAVDVLGMSEESWNRLLEGRLESDLEESRGLLFSHDDNHRGHPQDQLVINIGDLARVKDIITVRSTLFPETVIGTTPTSSHDDDSFTSGGLLDAHDEKDRTERSIDELLASLGGLDDDYYDEEKSEKDKGNKSSSLTEDTMDSKVYKLIEKLQDWRSKHQQAPYDSWDTPSKTEFQKWLSDYISVVEEGNSSNIDLNATREALLSVPPRYRDESDAFWAQVQDETDAELLLLSLHKPNDDDTTSESTPISQKKVKESLETFLSLPYSKQLRQIINLSTLRPILDEYGSEVDRLKFMEKYGEMLLEGMEIEHLVSDSNGPITLDDIDDSLLDKKKLDSNSRFSIKMIPYGTDEFGLTRSQRSRALYRAWSAQKAGRARYEESSFKKGRIGLSIHGDNVSK